MTVRELRAQLKKLEQDAQVVMADDAEGNNYSPYSEPSTGWYLPSCTWAGAQVEEFEEGSVRAVFLWPVN